MVRRGCLLALYRRAVDNGPPWRLSSVCGFLLAFYCPAVVLVRRGVCRPFCGSASTLLPCGGIVPPFVRLITLYRRAVDNGLPSVCVPAGSAISLMWRLSFVCGFCWHSIALRW